MSSAVQLAALDTLSHDARRAWVATHASEISASQLDLWWSRETAWRISALTAWGARGVAGRTAEALAAPCPFLRREAARTLARYARPEALVAAAATPAVRALVRAVARAERRDAAPALARHLLERGLLSCAAHLAHLVEGGLWEVLPPIHQRPSALAAAQPEALFALLARVPSATALLTEKSADFLALHDPLRFLEVARRGPVPALSAGLAAPLRQHPREAVALLLRAAPLRAGRLPRRALADALARVPPSWGRALLRQIEPRQAARILRGMPSQRGRPLLAALLQRAPWPLDAIDALPSALRAAAAAHALPSLSGEARTRALSYLTVEELEAHLAAAPALPREARNALLIRAALRARRCIEIVERLLPEGPLGDGALLALAALPCTSLTPDKAPLLKTLTWAALRSPRPEVGAAWEARARQVMARVTDPDNPLFQAAREVLLDRASARGTVQFPDFWPSLDVTSAKHFAARLLPWLRGASKREYDHNRVELYRALGPYGATVPNLERWVGEEALRAPTAHTVGAWLSAPATRLARMRALLEAQPAALEIPLVLRLVHRRAQEFILPHKLALASWDALIRTQPAGLRRWLPEQRRALAARFPPGALRDRLLRGCQASPPPPTRPSPPWDPARPARAPLECAVADYPLTFYPALEAHPRPRTATEWVGLRDAPVALLAREALLDFEGEDWRVAARVLLMAAPEHLEDALLNLIYLIAYEDTTPSDRDLPALQRALTLLRLAAGPEVSPEARALVQRMCARLLPAESRALALIDTPRDDGALLASALQSHLERASPWERDASLAGWERSLAESIPLDEAVALGLAAHPHPAVRRAGLRAVFALGEMEGWPRPLLLALGQLRRDPDPELRYEATRRFVHPEPPLEAP